MAQPVVFVGPSCAESDVRSALPEAIVLPPAGRGDLYRYRILGFAHFVILDGVFANAPAVSPREVVDVLRDGACVVGAASMGALRACDCRPAGAIGTGIVYRLFRRCVLSSEDEVAVVFRPDSPFPPLTEPLVNFRLALRRAVRAGVLGPGAAQAILAAAAALPYARRTWAAAIAGAGATIEPQALAWLKSCDAKRTDAVRCCEWVARQLATGRLPARPRGRARNVFGLLGDGRERAADPLDGADPVRIAPAFLDWLAARGRTALPEAPGDPATLAERLRKRSPGLDAALMQFTVYQRALACARLMSLEPAPLDLAEAERTLLAGHEAADWPALMARHAANEPLCKTLTAARRELAQVLRLRNGHLFPRPAAAPPATRAETARQLPYFRPVTSLR